MRAIAEAYGTRASARKKNRYVPFSLLRLGKPFAHEAYKAELEGLRDQLKLGLSEHPPEGSTPVAELAERIKALRGANTVEAAPERVGGRKAVRAERPVTARIRERRAEAEPESVAEVIELPVKAEEKPEPVTPPAVVPAMYRERLPEHAQRVTRRREDGAQLRLF